VKALGHNGMKGPTQELDRYNRYTRMTSTSPIADGAKLPVIKALQAAITVEQEIDLEA
jgi:hypothetical protein